MITTKPMTGEQLDELMAVAVRMQRDGEIAGDFPSANFAYAVQVAVLELRRTRDIAAALAAEVQTAKTMNDCLSEELRGYESDGAFEGPKMHLLWWKAETPATDTFLAEVRASTLEDMAKKKREESMSLHPDTFALGSVIAALDMQANELEDLAAQLRQDANTSELVAAGIITKVGE